jgi:hypothetical protein
MLKQVNLRASKSNLKTFTIQSCRKLIRALLNKEPEASNTVKNNSKLMLDPVPIKSIEDFDHFFTNFSKNYSTF